MHHVGLCDSLPQAKSPKAEPKSDWERTNLFLPPLAKGCSSKPSLILFRAKRSSRDEAETGVSQAKEIDQTFLRGVAEVNAK